MKTTVCLCTFNGERFLQPLLESLAGQTRRPDEVLVGDDLSSDGTLGLVEDFSRWSGLAVRVIRNRERRGPAGNLESLLMAAAGDLVLPCDQDDVWMSRKIERMEALMAEVPQPAIFADSALIDVAGRPLGGTLFRRIGLDGRERARLASGGASALVELAARNPVSSHALAIRREALAHVLPFGSRWQADWWIALVLGGLGGIASTGERLVAYRLHGGNTVGLQRQTAGRATAEGKERFLDRADLLQAALERVDRDAPGILSASDRGPLEERIDHLRFRANLPGMRRRRLRSIMTEMRSGGYRRFSNGHVSALADALRSP